MSNSVFSGFSVTSETIRSIDLNTGQPMPGALGSGFPARDLTDSSSYAFLDLLALPGAASSVAAIDNLYGASVIDGTVTQFNIGPDSLRIYDDTTARQTFQGPHAFACSSMVAGASAARIYCSNGTTLTRFKVDANGISPLDSFPLLPGRGPFGYMAFSEGRLYTTTGLVLDPEAKRTITRLETQGPVAVDGGLAYWLDPSTWTQAQPWVTLRSFDTATLRPVATRQINTSAADTTRLIVCGAGRLAFGAGHEIYIVNP